MHSRVTQKGSIGGQTQFRVNDGPEIGQHAMEYDPELGKSDLIIRQDCTKLTNSWVTFDPVSSEIYAVAKFMTSAKFMTLTLIYDPNPNPNPIPCEILDVEILDACADSPIGINFAQHRNWF